MLLSSLAVVFGDDLDSFIRSEMSKGKIPGLSAVAIKGDEILWHGHYGSALPSSTVDVFPVEANTVFEIASLSKTIIGLAVLKLKEMGLASPDDELNKHLPFTVQNPHFPDDPITLHGLLTHTSSISDNKYDDLNPEKLYSEGDPTMTMDDFYAAMLKPDGKWYGKSTFLRRKPQTHFEYSNIGAALAGYVTELIAKKAGLASTYDDFVRKHVLAPLNITSAGYFVSDFGGEDALSPPAGAIPSDYKRIRGKFVSYCFYNFPDYPDGAFKVSALDYAKLLGAVANGGSFQGQQLFTAETVAYLKQQAGAPCTPLPCGGDSPQGNAFYYYKKQLGKDMLGHNGGEMGIATEAYFNVDTGVGYVVLTNGDWGNSLTNAFSNAFEAIEQKLLQRFDNGTLDLGAVEAPAPRRGSRSVAYGDCPCGLPCDGAAIV